MPTITKQPAVKATPTPTLPAIPPCSCCGAQVPYLLESQSPCCRAYVAAYFYTG
jgi:hypothetical protein